MIYIQRVLGSIILFTLLVTQTGCKMAFYGRTEIDRIEFIRVVGVDKSPDKEDTVRLTIATQKVQPGGLTGGMKKQSNILYSEGSTVFEAVRNFWNFMDKRPFWGHLDYLLIGEEAAKDGLLKYIDFFSRDPELRLNLKVYITKGLDAKEVIKKGNSENKFVFDRLEGVAENQWGQSVFNVVDLVEVMYILDNEFLSLYIPCVELAKLSKDEKDINESMDIVMGGFAFFNGDKLIGHLNNKMGRGLNWLRNKIKSGVIAVKSPKGHNISLEIIESNTKIEAKITKGQLTVTARVKMSSNIGGMRSMEDVFTEEIIMYLENQQEQIIKDEIESVIKYAQKTKMDIFGAADAVFHKYPIQWEDMYKENWEDTFSNIKFYVDVNSKIRNTYDIKQPSGRMVGGGK